MSVDVGAGWVGVAIGLTVAVAAGVVAVGVAAGTVGETAEAAITSAGVAWVSGVETEPASAEPQAIKNGIRKINKLKSL
jgi:hypothetical protein